MAAQVTGVPCSAAARHGARRISAFWGFRGLVWAGVWPWGTTTACVTHWRQQGGGSGCGTACAAAEAALRDGAHRRARVCMNQSIIQGATGTVGREGAYRGSNLSWGVVRGVGVELRRWRRAAFVESGEESLQRSPGFWIQSRRCGDVLRRCRGGQASRRATGAEKSWRWSSSPVAKLGQIPVRARLGPGQAGSG